jgi:outer membrane protein assembly factor BamB
MVAETAIFLPGSDGKIYQLNTSDGTLYLGDGRPFTVESGVALGGLSTEDGTQLYVGTSSGTSTGRSYRINLTNGNLP